MKVILDVGNPDIRAWHFICPKCGCEFLATLDDCINLPDDATYISRFWVANDVPIREDSVVTRCPCVLYCGYTEVVSDRKATPEENKRLVDSIQREAIHRPIWRSKRLFGSMRSSVNTIIEEGEK